jgi:DNA-binding PadR family transcriptional regulator
MRTGDECFGFAPKMMAMAMAGHGRGGWAGPGHGDGARPPWAAFFDHRPGPGSRGPGGFPFPFFGGPRPSKARRGDVRTGILAVLADGQRNGYQIIQEISERTGGAWKPSPGSVYPTLQQLEDEGLVTADRPEGRRMFDLTEDGRAYVRDHTDELAEVWESMADAQDDGHQDMRAMIGQVMGAAGQVAFAGTSAQRDAARQVLLDARRRLYQILADGQDEEEER